MSTMLRLRGIAQYLQRAPEVLLARRETDMAATLLRRYLQIGRPDYPFTVQLRNGHRLSLASPGEVEVFWHIFVRQCYRLPAACRTVLDCGANVGLFSVWAASQRPEARVIALEPFPETFAALERNVRDNRLSGRVECVRLGLAATAGVRRMESGVDSPVRRMLPGQEVSTGETSTIECITLEECLDRFELPWLDMLKMDIEGSEWEVLLSTAPSVLARIGYVQLEYHEVAKHFGRRPEQLIDHLASGGLRMRSRHEDSFGTGIASFAQRP